MLQPLYRSDLFRVTAHFAEIRNEAGLLDDLPFRDLCRIPATALGGDCGSWRHFRETGGQAGRVQQKRSALHPRAE